MIARWSGLSRQPWATNSEASQSSSSGWVGASPCVPKLFGERTIPRPKWCWKTRLAITRAVRGFSGDAIQSARTRRRPDVFASAGRGRDRRRGRAEDLEEARLDLVARGVGVAAEQDERLGRDRAGLGHAEGRVADAPCASASRRGAGVPAGSAPSAPGRARVPPPSGSGCGRRWPSIPASRPRATSARNPARTTPRPGRGRRPSGSIPGGSARGPSRARRSPDLLAAELVDAVVLHDDPAADGEPGAVVGVEAERVRAILGDDQRPLEDEAEGLVAGARGEVEEAERAARPRPRT